MGWNFHQFIKFTGLVVLVAAMVVIMVAYHVEGQFIISAIAVVALAFAIWQRLRQKPPDD